MNSRLFIFQNELKTKIKLESPKKIFQHKFLKDVFLFNEPYKKNVFR
jgi:hypothetical protein